MTSNSSKKKQSNPSNQGSLTPEQLEERISVVKSYLKDLGIKPDFSRAGQGFAMTYQKPTTDSKNE